MQQAMSNRGCRVLRVGLTVTEVPRQAYTVWLAKSSTGFGSTGLWRGGSAAPVKRQECNGSTR